MLGLLREIFLHIETAQRVTQRSVHGRCGTFPHGFGLLLAAHGASVEIKVGGIGLLTKTVTVGVQHLPLHKHLLVLKRLLVDYADGLAYGIGLSHIHHIDILKAQLTQEFLPVQTGELFVKLAQGHLMVVA